MRLGRVLQKWRLIDGGTVRDVGCQMGVSPSTVSRLERGKGIDADSFGKILLWLLCDDERPKQRITDADEPKP